ncbi:LemA family protein [Thalassospira lucentensis]|uniref:LemA family protein n=1 Tax=Thalassospira lucentensis TaxID=168935 RepID=UPI003AA908C1
MEFVFLFILIGLVVWFVTMYNGLHRLANEVKRTKSNIMASMKKRVDLAQRLVDIAQSYGDHEKLTHVTTASNMTSIGEVMAASRNVDQVIGQVSSLAMAYPELKANATYQQLMEQLHVMESDILQRRESYNDTVSNYNSTRSSLPQALFSASLGFPEAPYYEVDENGLDVLADFKTDDGALLRGQLQRMGNKVADASVAAGRQLESKLTEIRDKNRQQALEAADKQAEPEADIPDVSESSVKEAGKTQPN